ncbi:MAG: hypothetical protein H6821_00665 [Planctomycetaceae bacterium]|nr:hypothetical protein [Planctomycetaceae bacterium]MCB9926147.1 hypothetical protein [Planctomycetaceae bacterium]
MKLPVFTLVFVIAIAVCLQPSVRAQVPTPPAVPPTLWGFLGIPQGLQRANAQLFNRRGNLPGLESKPQLLHLADPKNLESPVEAIKAAAEVKQAEDLKPQKIKAIKYLASIGCGCYDKDKKITKALIAAMSDCTEDVRLEAIKAIEEAASGECCANCSEKNCCSKEVSEMLAQIAYERDGSGCYLEPSERVREAAISALSVCCPNVGAPVYLEELPVEGTLQAPPIEGSESVPPSNGGAASGEQEASARRALSPTAETALRRQTSSRRTARLLNSTSTDVQTQQASRSTAEAQQNIAMVVDPKQNIARVSFREPIEGERLNVWTSTDYGYRFTGALVVFAVQGETALVRPVGDFELAELSPGTLVARSQD